MRLLLDTSAFLWFVDGSERLSDTARSQIENPGNELFLSVASIWEMAIKISLGRLDIAMPLTDFVRTQSKLSGMALLPVNEHHACGVADLPFHHRHPFDRLLVSQCHVEELTIVTPDAAFDAYGVKRVW